MNLINNMMTSSNYTYVNIHSQAPLQDFSFHLVMLQDDHVNPVLNP